MKIIRPTVIVDAYLTSSTVPEADYPVWSAATEYAVGAMVMRTTTHSVYKRAVAGTTATVPELDNVNWVRFGPTNRWAMFDSQVGTITTAPESLAVVLTPGRVNSLALLGLDASAVSVSLVANGETVYNASIDLDSGNTVGDWYQYFYEPIYQQESLVITDLLDAALMDIPAYGNGVLTVTLTRPGGSVACGALIVGIFAELGDTQYQPKIGITDYSRKDTDAFGNTTVIKRAFSKRMSADVMVKNGSVDNVSRILAQYRSTPLVWVAASNLYTSLIVYGFCKDWGIVIENYSFSNLSLDIEGLT